MSFHYLATPYTKYHAGLEAAFLEACKITARLAKEGLIAYSPIVHTHPIATHGGIDPVDHKFWMKFDEPMMAAAGALLVAHMSGWNKSKGIAMEVDYFERQGKPIYDLDIATLKWTQRQ